MVLLADASNAFNRLNRKQALRTARKRCPNLSVAFYNFYGTNGQLVLADGDSLTSEEGSTQGGPLGMAVFGVGSMPLIEEVEQDDAHQFWIADDSSSDGSVSATHLWFKGLSLLWLPPQPG